MKRIVPLAGCHPMFTNDPQIDCHPMFAERPPPGCHPMFANDHKIQCHPMFADATHECHPEASEGPCIFWWELGEYDTEQSTFN
jgi:hypothetical protein